MRLDSSSSCSERSLTQMFYEICKFKNSFKKMQLHCSHMYAFLTEGRHLGTLKIVSFGMVTKAGPSVFWSRRII